MQVAKLRYALKIFFKKTGVAQKSRMKISARMHMEKASPPPRTPRVGLPHPKVTSHLQQSTFPYHRSQSGFFRLPCFAAAEPTRRGFVNQPEVSFPKRSRKTKPEVDKNHPKRENPIPPVPKIPPSYTGFPNPFLLSLYYIYFFHLSPKGKKQVNAVYKKNTEGATWTSVYLHVCKQPYADNHVTRTVGMTGNVPLRSEGEWQGRVAAGAWRGRGPQRGAAMAVTAQRAHQRWVPKPRGWEGGGPSRSPLFHSMKVRQSQPLSLNSRQD